MNIVLWIIQGLLALLFLMAGGMKVSQTKEKLATNMGWVEDVTDGKVKLVGTLELLGALGLVLPGVTGIFPILTPLAALGLAATMVGAGITHARRQEYPNIVTNVVIMALALFVAYGRFALLPL